MLKPCSLILSLLLTLSAGMSMYGQTRSSIDILEQLPLSKVEGLWSMTSEDLLVLIIRNENGRLDMTIAPENVGSGFRAGQLIGYLEPTADKDCYWLYLEDVPKKKDKIKSVLGTLPFSKKCVLRLKDDAEVLSIDRCEASVSIRPLSLFPALNRLLKLHLKNPDSKVHDGFRKVYPGFDGGFGTNQRIIYL